ncbi:hypothetical protein BC828DRAFT_347133 [Blastocladiella britannica]|nr:hypothetical protein BC828DRAFT_347133 [Blastocladiella britannica]
MALFGHLPPPTPPTAAASSSSSSSSRGTQAVGPLHPAVLGIGHRMASGLLVGANARARAMLDAFAAVVRDYATPPDAMLSRHLAQVLGAHISYLSDVRPLTPGMGAAIRGLKHVVSSVAPDMPDPDAKELIIEYIDTFIHERITMAVASLSQLAMPKIKSGDVILTYGYSSSVASILRAVAASGLSFRAIVVDDPAAAAGAVGGVRMARDVLVPAGVPVTYVQLTGAGSAVRDASMVLLGATGMLAHGGLLARAGTAAVAMLARARNVPVVVACETYKFSHAIHLDSIVFNELAPITPLGGATGGEESSAVKRLALVYDVTPPEFLTVVITELGLMPVTSVPVVLREYKPLLESGGPLAVSS